MSHEFIELCSFGSRCGDCGDDCDVCLVNHGDSSEPISLLQQSEVLCRDSVLVDSADYSSSAGSLTENNRLTELVGDPLTEPSDVIELIEASPEDLAGPEMAPTVYMGIGFTPSSDFAAYSEIPVLGIRRRITNGSNSNSSLGYTETSKGVLVLRIFATVCLLFSIIIFLCVLDDIYCLIPASCLLVAGIVSCIIAVVSKKRQS
ncbi:hypothetical protein [Candidatus Ichthyocystis hellenicum]|uniref:hypothetical protein n=1 Tax=Candidatus Ichthyocystis hellenicum TaxID=1561003 RepID=UPI000B803605|nr:hypothetical protein [Candidatus Ichthyocystis hellenicum]